MTIAIKSPYDYYGSFSTWTLSFKPKIKYMSLHFYNLLKAHQSVLGEKESLICIFMEIIKTFDIVVLEL